jgi:hypothetical protein
MVISVSYGIYPAIMISINYLTCELVHVEDLVYTQYILRMIAKRLIPCLYLYQTETIDLLQDSVHKIQSSCISHIIS